MSEVVSIIGQGYVGLPLAMLIADKKYKVHGIDHSIERVNLLNSSVSNIEDVSSDQLESLINVGLYSATSNFELIRESQVVIICVPTPLNSQNLPDLSHLEQAISNFARFMKPETLVIVESTIAPTTTREFVYPLIKKHSGLDEDKFFLAYSPERIDPLNKDWTLSTTPKLVSAINSESMSKAVNFYENFFEQIVRCSSLEIAEMSKVLENSFRLVNISFLNEISILCHRLNIEVSEVINVANTKPYGFMAFYPGLGVGGHCIPVDPVYLSRLGKEVGVPMQMIDLAVQINSTMPDFIVARAKKILTDLQGKRILVIGIAYKKNLADTRESSSITLIYALRNLGALVFWHDDLVKTWNNELSTPISDDFDLVILATSHNYLRLNDFKNIKLLDTSKSI